MPRFLFSPLAWVGQGLFFAGSLSSTQLQGPFSLGKEKHSQLTLTSVKSCPVQAGPKTTVTWRPQQSMARRAGAAPVSPAPAPSSHLSPWVQAGRTAGRLGRDRGLAELVCWLLSFPRNHRTRSLDEAGSHRCLGKAKNSGTLGPIPQQHWDCRPHTGQISPLLEDSSPGLLPESYINQPELRDCPATPSLINPSSLTIPQDN